MAVAERRRVQSLRAPDAAEMLGVNDKQQLAQLEAVYRRRRALRAPEPWSNDRRSRRGSMCAETSRSEPDVLLDVNVVLEGPVRLGDGVQHRTQLRASVTPRSARVRCCMRTACYRMRRSGRTVGSGRSRACGPARAFAEACISVISSRSRTARSAPGSKVNHLSYVGRCNRRRPASTSAPARSPATTMARTSGARASAMARSSARARCWWHP